MENALNSGQRTTDADVFGSESCCLGGPPRYKRTARVITDMIADVRAHARAVPLALCLFFIVASILALHGCGTNSAVPEMETSCTSGEECDDENPCTENDKCDSDGECVGELVLCNDQRECTDDACDAAGKCVHDLRAGYCLINGSCYEDGEAKPDSPCMECTTAVSKSEWMNDDTNECGVEDKCNAGAHCLEGECIPGKLLDCNDDNECTDDSCDPETGCVFANVAASCDDGDLCTEDDSCKDGVCAGALLDCSDGNQCTEDSCSPDKGCQNMPAIGPCDDGEGCTLEDQCSDGVCAGVPCEELDLYCLEGECAETICGALSLDGEDDYVEVPHAGNLSLAGEFSIEVWFRTEATTSSRALLRKGAGVANYLIFLMSDMTLVCGMYVSGAAKNAYYAQGKVPIEAGVWHHLAMTFDGVQVRAYLDGALHASEEVPGPVVTNTSPLTFGYGYPTIFPDAFTHGAIDEVRIWERALSGDEIQNKAFEILDPETEIGLVGWWDFNEEQGEIAHDSSGNGNHGTVFGAQWTDQASGPVCCATECLGKECGGDGCGGSCGECAGGHYCGGGACQCDALVEPSILWEATLGGSQSDGASAITVTPDGGYVVLGNTGSQGAGAGDMWLVKLDAEGNNLWGKTWGGTELDVGTAVVSLDDGTFAFAGYTKSNGALSVDGSLVRMDGDGNVIWEQTYGGTGSEEPFAVALVPGGGFALAGVISPTNASGDWDFWLVRTDSEGNKLWERTYGTAGEDWPCLGVVALPDGGFALAGGTKSKGAGGGDFWLLRTDDEGNLLWDKTYGGASKDYAYDVVLLPDGGFALGGITDSKGAGGRDFWLVRTDSEGNMMWDATYGGSSSDSGNDLVALSDGGFAMIGSTKSFGAGSSDALLVRTDDGGNLLWQTTYGTAGPDEPRALAAVNGDGFALVGFTPDAEGLSNDLWILVTDGECCATDCTDKECGDDGCGGSCGECGEGLVCQWGKCLDTTAATYKLIPAGEFIMGSPDGSGATPAEKCRSAQEIQHKVQLSHPFWMKATEVTIGEWTAVSGSAAPSEFQACGPNCPANAMTWYQAVEYCNALSSLEGLPQCYVVSDEGDVNWPAGYACQGYRLPTEAEWEYAARAGTTTALYNGPLEHCGCEYDAILATIAWYVGNYLAVAYEGCVDTSENSCPGPPCAGPQPVAQKDPNPWALFDMSGNVWEWCWDWLGPYGSDAIDPLGPPFGEKKLLRGGSWGDYAQHARSAGRLAYAASYSSYPMGFRPVRTACEFECEDVGCGVGFCGGDCGPCP